MLHDTCCVSRRSRASIGRVGALSTVARERKLERYAYISKNACADCDYSAVQDRNEEWWIDVRIEGRRGQRRAPVQSLEGALEFETATRRRAEQGGDPEPRALSSKSTFAQFSEVWMTNYVMVANKHSTIR